jgi:hypothetical protein
MNKQTAAKLGQHAETLLDMDDLEKTPAEMLAWLKAAGVEVAPEQLSEFLESRRFLRLRDHLHALVRSVGRQCRELEKQSGKNPQPELLKVVDQMANTAIRFMTALTDSEAKGRAARLAAEKFQKSQQTKLEAGLDEAASAYPYTVAVAGTWNAPDGNLVEVEVLLRASTDTADRVCLDSKFPPQGSRTFSLNVQVEQAGSYTIKLIARDANNFTTENDIALTVTGSGAKCAAPVLTLADGTVVPTFDTGTTDWTAVFFSTDTTPVLENYTPYFGAGSFGSPAIGGPAIPYGPLNIACTTPGAAIEFYADTYVGSKGQSLTPPAQNTSNRVAYPAYQPVVAAGRTGGLLYIFFQASAAGMTSSNIQGAILQVGMAGP